MTITNKIQHTTPSDVKLYKEGIFWKAYEQSAYAILQLRTYQAKKEYVKIAAAEVVSIGFPDSVLESIIAAFEVVTKEEFKILLKTREPIDLAAFEVWKKALPLKEKEVNVKPPQNFFHNGKSNSLATSEGINESELNVLRKLRAFDLSNATPMQGMVFLAELKKGIQVNE